MMRLAAYNWVFSTPPVRHNPEPAILVITSVFQGSKGKTPAPNKRLINALYGVDNGSTLFAMSNAKTRLLTAHACPRLCCACPESLQTKRGAKVQKCCGRLTVHQLR